MTMRPPVPAGLLLASARSTCNELDEAIAAYHRIIGAWSPRMLDGRSQAAYLALVRVARGRSTITYGDLAEIVGTSARSVGRVVLDPICAFEEEAGRPPITELVVNQETGRPSMDRPEQPGDWEAMCEAVYEYWGD